MHSEENINQWIEKIKNLWISQGIPIGEPALPDTINKIEIITGIIFPESFKLLYQTVDGFKYWEWNEHMFSIWSLERIKDEYDYQRFPGFIGFSDFLINSHWIGFVRGEIGIYKQYSLKDYPKPEKIADNFIEAIDMINSNNDLIY